MRSDDGASVRHRLSSLFPGVFWNRQILEMTDICTRCRCVHKIHLECHIKIKSHLILFQRTKLISMAFLVVIRKRRFIGVAVTFRGYSRGVNGKPKTCSSPKLVRNLMILSQVMSFFYLSLYEVTSNAHKWPEHNLLSTPS